MLFNSDSSLHSIYAEPATKEDKIRHQHTVVRLQQRTSDDAPQTDYTGATKRKGKLLGHPVFKIT